MAAPTMIVCANRLFSRRDWLAAVIFFCVGLVLYVPTRSGRAYWYDCAQSALAVEEYDLVKSQPHVPGYLLYIMTARAVNQFVGDPFRSLIWISVVSTVTLAG